MDRGFSYRRVIAFSLIGFLIIGGITAYARLGDITTPGDFFLTNPTVPSGPTDAGTTGQISWDNNYVYICVATDTWKRTQIDTWAAVIEYILLETGDFLLLETGDKMIK